MTAYLFSSQYFTLKTGYYFIRTPAGSRRKKPDDVLEGFWRDINYLEYK
jgi:hypothetical protein